MTRTRKNEIVVGIFVIIVLVVLFGMTFIIRGSTGISPYTVRAQFENVSGLEIGSPVLVQGFRTGRVIEMAPGKSPEGEPMVIVISKVARTIPIHKNATVTLAQQGFIGDKRLEINPGTSDTGEIQDGDMLESIPPLDIGAAFAEAQEIVADLKAVVSNLREFTEDKERIARIDETIRNVQESTDRLNRILEENSANLKATMENAREVSEKSVEIADRVESLTQKLEGDMDELGGSAKEAIAELRESGRQLTERIDKLLAEAEGVGTNANELLTTSRAEIETLSTSLQRASNNLNLILEEINEGNGTVGRLIKDPKPLEDIQKSIATLQSALGEEDSAFYGRTITYDDGPSAANLTSPQEGDSQADAQRP